MPKKLSAFRRTITSPPCVTPSLVFSLLTDRSMRMRTASHTLAQIRKRLLYTVATISHFEEGPSSHPSLPTNVTNLCASIQEQLIAHFTPILFTVATASHMTCTDVFAEQWMSLVIGPALESSGLCRPVETLRRIQTVQWESHGLCETCCAEKREEWEDEIKVIWRKIDEWITPPTPS